MRTILCTLLFITAALTNAQTVISLNGTTYSEVTMPKRDVEQVGDGIIVTYYFDNALIMHDLLYPECIIWQTPGFGLNETIGKPSIPSRWDAFVLPNNANFSVEILDSSYIDYSMQLSPARPFLLEDDSLGYNKKNVPPIIAYDGYYPYSLIKSSKGSDYRGKKLLTINTSSLQYNCQKKTIRAYKMIQYKISFADTNTGENNPIKIDEKDNYLAYRTINHSPRSFKVTNINKTSESIQSNRDYLILTSPELEPAAEHFAEWKRILGFRTHVQVIPKNSPSSYIKNTIKDVYNDNNINLYYLLILGTENHVRPVESTDILTTVAGTHYTDFYYACMGDEDDLTPDINIGRLPADNLSEAIIMVDKIISYEKSPIVDEEFYQTGIHCAFFYDTKEPESYEDNRFVFLSEQIKNYINMQGKNVKRMYRSASSTEPLYWKEGFPSNGDSIPIELRKPEYNWDARFNDINQNINQGAFYILYRGHGRADRWELPTYRISHIDSLRNRDQLPIVFGICCSTGKFESSKNLAESFLSKQNGGCVAMFAASSKSFNNANDYLSEGMFDAIWPNPGLHIHSSLETESTNYRMPTYEIGKILNVGMSRVETYSTVSAVRTQKELYHCFGDPSMEIRTENPSTMQTPFVCRINDTVYVEVADGDARISFYTPTTQQVATFYGTDVCYSTAADSVVICIYRHNYIPYITNSNELIYVQDETISNNKIYQGNVIKIGNNVTDKKAQGNVVVNGGHVDVKGKRIELQNGVHILKGSKFHIGE